MNGANLLARSLCDDRAPSVDKGLDTQGEVTVIAITTHTVDNTDWLKTVAIILVMVDHIGYFFIEDDKWWSVFGRLAAPTFFFLLGYAQTRGVPRSWIGLGLDPDSARKLESRLGLGSPEHSLELRAYPARASLCAKPFATSRVGRLRPTRLRALRLASSDRQIVDYGAEGWLWALFGLSQRIYVDAKSVTNLNGTSSNLGAGLRPQREETWA